MTGPVSYAKPPIRKKYYELYRIIPEIEFKQEHGH